MFLSCKSRSDYRSWAMSPSSFHLRNFSPKVRTPMRKARAVFWRWPPQASSVARMVSPQEPQASCPDRHTPKWATTKIRGSQRPEFQSQPPLLRRRCFHRAMEQPHARELLNCGTTPPPAHKCSATHGHCPASCKTPAACWASAANDGTGRPSRRAAAAKKRSARTMMSSRRSRKGGKCTGNTFKRYNKSSRNRPARTSAAKSRLVAAITRTSVRIERLAPTRSNVRS